MLFLEGKLSGTSHDVVGDHVKNCSECVFVLGEANRFLQEQEDAAAEEEIPPPRAVSAWWLAAAAAVVIVCGAAVWRWQASRDAMHRMTAAAATENFRALEGRLRDFPHAPFERHLSDTTALTEENATLRTVARAVAEERVDGENAADFHTRGVAELLSGRARTSVVLLSAAANQAPSEPGYWSDLAVARIALARTDGDPAQLSTAISDAEHALALDARFAPALFNRAVARQSLGMNAEASADFRRAAALEPGSPWASEASSRANDATQ